MINVTIKCLVGWALNIHTFVDLSYCNDQVLGVIGDDVLKNVATRVTIEGTAADGSPLEVSPITKDSIFEILEQARMKND